MAHSFLVTLPEASSLKLKLTANKPSKPFSKIVGNFLTEVNKRLSSEYTVDDLKSATLDGRPLLLANALSTPVAELVSEGEHEVEFTLASADKVVAETHPAAAVDISEDLSTRELAVAAKARGNKAHGLNTLEGFVVAIAAYKEAISHDPTDHIFYANLCASYIELSKVKWKPGEVVDAAAKAVEAASKCTTMAPTWAKGFLRQATAEECLLKARAKWKEALAKPKTKWDEEQAMRDGPEPQPANELLGTIEGLSFARCEATCRAGLALDPSCSPLKMKLQALRDEGHTTDEAGDMAMSDVALAAPLKAEGNVLFSSKQFEKAAAKYTEALAMSPLGEGAHILYSNRSACHAELEAGGEWVGNQGSKALHDAEMCLKLAPGFAKGYSRKSAALYHLGKYVEAEAAAREGLAIEPANAALQSLLETAKVETAETAEVQAKMHEMRKSRAKDAKLKSMLSGLNLGDNMQEDSCCASPKGGDCAAPKKGGG